MCCGGTAAVIWCSMHVVFSLLVFPLACTFLPGTKEEPWNGTLQDDNPGDVA